jgi:hypothetical protein
LTRLQVQRHQCDCQSDPHDPVQLWPQRHWTLLSRPHLWRRVLVPLLGMVCRQVPDVHDQEEGRYS